MKKIEVFKTGLGLVISVGVGAIVGNAITTVRPQDVGKIKNLCISIGALALTNMVSDNVIDHTNNVIDNVISKDIKVSVSIDNKKKKGGE